MTYLGDEGDLPDRETIEKHIGVNVPPEKVMVKLVYRKPRCYICDVSIDNPLQIGAKITLLKIKGEGFICDKCLKVLGMMKRWTR